MSDLVAYQGRESDHSFTYQTKEGNAINISSAKIKFSVVDDRESETPLFERANTAGGGGETQISFDSDGSDGKFIVHVIASNTSDLDIKTYVWEIIMELDDSTKKIGEGRFVVKNSWATAFA